MILVALIVVCGIPAVGMASSVHATLINPERDLEYLGAFRLPDENSNGTSWSYGGYGMCFYPAGDPSGPADGFPGSLFSIGHPYQGYVSEFDIPAPVISPQKDISVLPKASTLQPFADVTGGRQTGGLTGTVLGDVQYYPRQGEQEGDKLYWVMYEYYQPEPDAAWHGWCEVDLSDPRPQGTWRLDDFPAAATSRYLFDIPTEWADRYTPGLYLAAGRFRVVNGGSWGPALYAFGPWNDGNPPPNGSSVTAVELLKYNEDHRLRNFSNSDEWSDGAWLTVGNKAAVIFVGTKALRTRASGLEYYGGPGVDGCGYKGYHGEPYYGAILFYDPYLVAEVAKGNLRSDEVQPYAVFNVDDYMFRQGCRRSILGGVAYDRKNHLLYVVERYADGYFERKPIVHVFRVTNRSRKPDTDPPTPPTNLRIAMLTPTEVTLVWDPAVDDVHLAGYIVYRDGEPIATTVEPTFTDDKVNPAATYIYAVRAWDARTNMSESASIWVITPPGTDDRPPIISNVRIVDITPAGAVVSWHTDEPASTHIEYGPRGGEMEVFTDPVLVTEHRVVLSGLTPGREYICAISATDAARNTRIYARKSFSTPRLGSPGGFAPVLNSIGAKRVYEGETLEFTLEAEDRDSDVLIYRARDLPSGAHFDPFTRRFSWTPKVGDAGIYHVKFEVTDGVFSDSEEVTIFVIPAQQQ